MIKYARQRGVLSPGRAAEPEAADVVVVGGGITGLAAAHRLATAGPPRLRVVLLEAEPTVGGKIRTATFCGRSLDEGPDGIVDTDAVRDLSNELGISSAAVHAAGERPAISTRRGLRPVPPGLISGVPVRPSAVVRSGLLSPLGLARAGLDLALAASRPTHDVSVADLVRRRLGAEVVDRLVAPLIGAVYAGDVAQLSAEAVAPTLFAAARRHRSLIVGLRRGAGFATPPGRGLTGFRGGLGTVVDALAAALGPRVRCAAPVVAIHREADAWRVRTPHEVVRAGHIVVATPAPTSGRLLQPVALEAAAALERIPYASVAVVTLAYDRDAVTPLPTASGFLVPPSRGLLVTAGTWLSVKWPAATESGPLLLRCSVGRIDDERGQQMGDGSLVAAVHEEVTALIGVRSAPLATRVRRWPQALPQYTVGHGERVALIRAIVGPTLLLAGAAYDGIGVAACIAQGRAAADQILERMADPATPGTWRTA